MARKLIVTLNDGTTQEFDVDCGSRYGTWSHSVGNDRVLRIWQGNEQTVFPLTSVIRWDVKDVYR